MQFLYQHILQSISLCRGTMPSGQTSGGTNNAAAAPQIRFTMVTATDTSIRHNPSNGRVETRLTQKQRNSCIPLDKLAITKNQRAQIDALYVTNSQL